MTAPGGPGESGKVYDAFALEFTSGLHWLDQLVEKNPTLRITEACIRSGRINITTVGGSGVRRDWIRALPPIVVEDTGIYQHQSLVGMTDVLKTGHVTVTIQRPL